MKNAGHFFTFTLASCLSLARALFIIMWKKPFRLTLFCSRYSLRANYYYTPMYLIVVCLLEKWREVIYYCHSSCNLIGRFPTALEPNSSVKKFSRLFKQALAWPAVGGTKTKSHERCMWRVSLLLRRMTEVLLFIMTKAICFMIVLGELLAVMNGIPQAIHWIPQVLSPIFGICCQ